MFRPWPGFRPWRRRPPIAMANTCAMVGAGGRGGGGGLISWAGWPLAWSLSSRCQCRKCLSPLPVLKHFRLSCGRITRGSLKRRPWSVTYPQLRLSCGRVSLRRHARSPWPRVSPAPPGPAATVNVRIQEATAPPGPAATVNVRIQEATEAPGPAARLLSPRPAAAHLLTVEPRQHTQASSQPPKTWNGGGAAGVGVTGGFKPDLCALAVGTLTVAAGFGATGGGAAGVAADRALREFEFSSTVSFITHGAAGGGAAGVAADRALHPAHRLRRPVGTAVLLTSNESQCVRCSASASTPGGGGGGAGVAAV